MVRILYSVTDKIKLSDNYCSTQWLDEHNKPLKEKLRFVVDRRLDVNLVKFS